MALNLIAVGIGGFLGSVARYLTGLFFKNTINPDFPVATLVVNVVGGFIIGFIMESTRESNKMDEKLKLFLTTGLMGGLTTFSTFSYETMKMFESGKVLAGGLNTVLNVALSLLGTYTGILLARKLKNAA